MKQARRLSTLVRPVLVSVLAVVLSATVLAQRGGYFGSGSASSNQRYDGRFVFVRVSYNDFQGRGGPRWAHDYPRGEEHFMKILDALTVVDGHVEEHNIMSLNDPELFKFPLIYMADVGRFALDGEIDLVNREHSGDCDTRVSRGDAETRRARRRRKNVFLFFRRKG